MAKTPTRNGSPKLDQIDIAILRELQTCSKITNTTLAEHVGISPPSTLERVRKLETSGIIQGYVALLDPPALGKRVQALVHLSLSDHSRQSIDDAKTQLALIEDVQACWHTAGEEDFILRVVVSEMSEFERFMREKLSSVRSISRVRTSFVLSTPKQSTRVPLDMLEAMVSESESPRRSEPVAVRAERRSAPLAAAT